MKGGKIIAAIDIGSHTARLLISSENDSTPGFSTVLRKRAYTRLAEGFSRPGNTEISMEAATRALEVIQDFIETAREENAVVIQAVATGVVRIASNREWFLEQIFKRTGIEASVIPGEKEAALTRKGVLSSLKKSDESPVIFDLGGGTTEFISEYKGKVILSSVPLGSMVLTNEFLGMDLPDEESVARMSNHVDHVLGSDLSGLKYNAEKLLLVGSGGTVTTLAAILNSIDIKEITPENINGLILKRDMVESLFLRMKTQPVNDRLGITGLDPGRAEVILAGTLAVIRILYFFKAVKMMVSFSDILEGITIAYLQGEDNE